MLAASACRRWAESRPSGSRTGVRTPGSRNRLTECINERGGADRLTVHHREIAGTAVQPAPGRRDPCCISHAADLAPRLGSRKERTDDAAQDITAARGRKHRTALGIDEARAIWGRDHGSWALEDDDGIEPASEFERSLEAAKARDVAAEAHELTIMRGEDGDSAPLANEILKVIARGKDRKRARIEDDRNP